MKIASLIALTVLVSCKDSTALLSVVDNTNNSVTIWKEHTYEQARWEPSC